VNLERVTPWNEKGNEENQTLCSVCFGGVDLGKFPSWNEKGNKANQALRSISFRGVDLRGVGLVTTTHA
jgi:hypothetical protein